MKFKHIFITGVLMILSLGVGFGLGQEGFRVNYAKGATVTISRVTPLADLNFSLFWKVWDLLNSTYYDKTKINPSKMVYGAIQGMVASLGDPYTMFLPPSENQITNEDLDGNFAGVGIELGYKGQQLAVIAPLPGSPAEKAGILPGDLIIGIKDLAKNIDTGTDNLSLTQAVQDIRGTKGTRVTLAISRAGLDKPLIIDLIRDQINVPSVTLNYVGENKDIAHISVLKFGGDTFIEWQKKAQEIKAHQPLVKGIILDLRNNPGGYLQDAVDIAGEFLPQGSIAVIQQSGDGSKTNLKTDHEGPFVNSKVTILVNGGSASASEILAGALRDDRKIELVGEKTFGKGTVQQPADLDGGAGLHITVAKWLTPNGTWVHGVGLTPDVKVSSDPNSKTDVQLDAAIKLINS
jgi:carboxyl-terminal processing protease